MDDNAVLISTIFNYVQYYAWLWLIMMVMDDEDDHIAAWTLCGPRIFSQRLQRRRPGPGRRRAPVPVAAVRSLRRFTGQERHRWQVESTGHVFGILGMVEIWILNEFVILIEFDCWLVDFKWFLIVYGKVMPRVQWQFTINTIGVMRISASACIFSSRFGCTVCFGPFSLRFSVFTSRWQGFWVQRL